MSEEDHTSDQVALPPAVLIRRLLDASDEGLVVLDDAWRYVFANRAAADFFHLPAQSLLGRSIREQYPDIDTTLFGTAIRAATASGETRTVVNVRGPDGREFDVSAVPAGGHIAIQFRDVTDARRIEVALRQSEARFRLLAESAPIGVVLCDAGGQIIYANPYVRDVIGRAEAELRGDRWARWVHPEDAARVTAEWVTFRTGYNASLHQEYRFVRSTGEIRWVRSRVARLLVAERAAIGYVETLEDVTALRAAAERQRVLAATIEGSSDFVAAADPAGRTFYVNAAGLRLVGVSGLGPVQSMALQDFVAPGDREPWTAEVLPMLEREGAWTGELRLHELTSGRTIPTDAHVFAVRERRDGPVLAIAMVSRDITERTKLEAQFRQSQKMEAVGLLAGGIAHDFNNLLTVIKTYSELALDELPGESPVRPDLREISNAASRAASLTRQLLAFSRKQLLQPRVLQLATVVTELESMLRRLIGEDIEIVLDVAGDAGFVRADPGQLEQVLLNLAVNARDAMPHGGMLRIGTAAADVAPDTVPPHPSVPPGRYAVLTVLDSGSGMDASTMARIFEPFFTTKEAGRGTGLGLATVYGIVQQSGGHVWAESAPERGACFYVYLPAVAAADGRGEAPPAGPDRQRGTETVLVAEDDPAVRTLMRTLLRSNGYTVLEAADGADAMRMAEGYAGTIDILLTDVVMPSLGGRALLERMRAARPALRVLYVSGYVDDEVMRRGGLDAGEVLLAKPFTADDLLQAVRGALSPREQVSL